MIFTINETEIFANVHIVDKAKDVLVLGHGATAHAESFGFLYPHLKEVNYIAYDMPAHLRSKGAPLATIEEMADFAEAFMKEARNVLDLTGGFIFAGHSLSGAVGIELGIRQTPLKALILIATTANYEVVTAPSFIEDLKNGHLDVSFFSRGFSPKTPSAYLDGLLAKVHLVSTETMYYDFLASSKFNKTAQLKDITVPTHVFAGSDDFIVPSEHFESLVANLSNIQSLAVLEDAGHFLVTEKPEILGAELTDIVQKLQ